MTKNQDRTGNSHGYSTEWENKVVLRTQRNKIAFEMPIPTMT